MRTRGQVLHESSISSSARTNSCDLRRFVDQLSSEQVRKVVHGRDARERVRWAGHRVHQYDGREDEEGRDLGTSGACVRPLWIPVLAD